MHRYRTLILLLGPVSGASYLFIKVAVEGGLEPALLMCARTAIAVVVLFAYLVRLGGLALILAGVALGSGVSRAARRSAQSGASDAAEARAA